MCDTLYIGAPSPVDSQQLQTPTSVATGGTVSGTSHFAVGDCVKVQLEVEIFKMMQEGHGGWNDDMCEVKTHSSYRKFVYDNISIMLISLTNSYFWTALSAIDATR